MKTKIVLILMCVFIWAGNGFADSDLVLEGENSWLFHTPDDEKGDNNNLYILPRIGNNWDWSKQISFLNNGSISMRNSFGIHYDKYGFPGVSVTKYSDSETLGHPVFWMRNYGGSIDGITATKKNSLLGTLIFGGHDGKKGTQNGRITVKAIDDFKEDSLPVKMYFQLGGESCYAGYTRMTIDGETGNVGIGTENPGEYRLAVKGKIHTDEIVVETGWADYVFEDDYKLISLSEVETFIKKNKHLPEVPSEKEITKNGLSMSKMMEIQMKKIEELTLHLINMNKQNKEQNKRIVQLEKKLRMR
ncbi:MAG: hypothetical protein GY714_31905 [Desulfobacterales bacterium]|nr:hypothetical protein [Desulfobacterales bacterium]